MDSVGSIIVYVVIALAIVICSVLAVTTRKILRAATYLLFALFATAGLYFQLDYEFLGAVQIAVYAGGIVVLFVFSILRHGQVHQTRGLFGWRSYFYHFQHHHKV